MATPAKQDFSMRYTWELDQTDNQHLHIRVHANEVDRWVEVSVYPAPVGNFGGQWMISEAYTEVGTGDSSVTTGESRTYEAACRKAYAQALKWLHDELGTGQKRPRRLP